MTLQFLKNQFRPSTEAAPTHEPCHDIGRAALPCRFGIKAVQQHSPTRKRFMVTRRENFQMGAIHEPRQRCAAFMPLQCGICEGIRIVPMLLDVPTLKRCKFRDPRIMSTRRVKFRMRLPMNLVTSLVGRCCYATLILRCAAAPPYRESVHGHKACEISRRGSQ